MKLWKIVIIPASVVLCACASRPATPTFIQPSTKAIATGHAETKAHISKAQTGAGEIKVVVQKVQDPALRLELTQKVDALTVELDEAQTALASSEGARLQLDSELKTQTDLANQASADLRTLQPKLDTVTHKYHVVKFILAGLASAVGALVGLRFLGPYGLLGAGLGPLVFLIL